MKQKNNNKNKRLTASHIMLYVALVIYIAVIVSGIVLLRQCAAEDNMEAAKYIYTAIASASTVCGSAVVGFYAAKATRENVLQISNGKYRMRLDLAKEIYKEFKGKSLDEQALQLMRVLISDENVQADTTVGSFIGSDNIANEEEGKG